MTAGLDILGTRLPIHLTMYHVDHTVWNVKQAIRINYGVPTDRQTFRLLPGGQILDELERLSSDGMEIYRGGDGGRIDLEENMEVRVWEFLIMNWTILWVEFTTNFPPYGGAPLQPAVV